jgi:hypothetical protein
MGFIGREEGIAAMAIAGIDLPEEIHHAQSGD